MARIKPRFETETYDQHFLRYIHETLKFTKKWQKDFEKYMIGIWSQECYP